MPQLILRYRSFRTSRRCQRLLKLLGSNRREEELCRIFAAASVGCSLGHVAPLTPPMVGHSDSNNEVALQRGKPHRGGSGSSRVTLSPEMKALKRFGPHGFRWRSLLLPRLTSTLCIQVLKFTKVTSQQNYQKLLKTPNFSRSLLRSKMKGIHEQSLLGSCGGEPSMGCVLVQRPDVAHRLHDVACSGLTLRADHAGACRSKQPNTTFGGS